MNLDMDSKTLEAKNTSEVTNWALYRHISPSGRIYIGITSKEVNRRWRYGTGYSNCILFQNAIDKYGWNNIIHEILFTNLTEERAKNLEKNLIRHYKNLGISYNITDGGDGHLGCSWSPSFETRTLWSEQRKGRKLSTEHKEKISNTMKGKPMRKDIYSKGVAIVKVLLAKPVIQLDMNGEFIKEFPSIKEAARSVGIKSDRDIIRCCRGERKSRAGYRWKYKEE